MNTQADVTNPEEHPTDRIDVGETEENFDENETSARKKKPTEKGLEYEKQKLEKRFHDGFRQLKFKSEEIKSIMSENADISLMKEKHREWMSLFEAFYAVFDNLCSVLNPQERQHFAEKYFLEKDSYVRQFKSTFDDWFSKYQSYNTVDIEPSDSVSQVRPKSSTSRSKVSRQSRYSKSSSSSSMSAAKLQEDQKQAELAAKAAIMKQKQELELAQMKLRMEQEELDLRMEMAMNRARREVLEKYDNTNQSHQGESTRSKIGLHSTPQISKSTLQHDTNTFSKYNTITIAPHENDSNKLEQLNPLAKEFSPIQLSQIGVSENYKGDNPVRSRDVNQPNIPSPPNSPTNAKTKEANGNVNGNIVHYAYNRKDSDINCDKIPISDNGQQVNTNSYGFVSQSTDGKTHEHVNDNVKKHVNVNMPNNTNNSISDVNIPVILDPLTSVIRHIRKPLPDLKKFSGDPINYRKFLRQFNSTVVLNSESDEEKMNFLEQFTIGEANRIVSGFSFLDAKVGYPAALQELEERYGNRETIANAYVHKALKWPNVKPENPKGLDDFSIFLVECQFAISEIEAVRILEYTENMKQIVGKLPYYCHERWRGVVQRLKERNERLTFRHLVDFVKSEAKRANDPTFGKDAMRNQFKPSTFPNKVKSRGSFAATELKGSPNHASSNEEKPPVEKFHKTPVNTHPSHIKEKVSSSPCIFCLSGSHSFDQCESLSKVAHYEKINFLKTRGLCFGCLRSGHMRSQCKRVAVCEHCSGRHPTVLHSDDFKRKDSMSKEASFACPSNSLSVQPPDNSVCTMAILPVKVKLKDSAKIVNTYAFMDPGSSVSFCTEGLMRKIGGKGKRMKITLDTIGSSHTMTTHSVENVQVCDLNMNHFVDLPRLYTKDSMPVREEHIPTADDVQRWTHLMDLNTPRIEAEIGLLIGNNAPDAYSPLEVRVGPQGSPHATRSRLGWILWNVVRQGNKKNGSCKGLSVNRIEVKSIKTVEDNESLERLVRKAINLDFPERLCDERKEFSEEDKIFLRKVEESITLIIGHYQVDLPFKTKDFKLPNNEEQVKRRLLGIKKKMEKNPDFYNDYCEFMSKILEAGYAEPVPEEEVGRDDGRVWYIPHHGVYHPRKPNKIRVVFDCAASYEGVSLNSLLLQGPDLTNSLLGVLLRFRQDPVAIMGDIESMFYQVKVPKTDSDCLRFYWWPNGDLNVPPAVFRMNVHLFGAVSSPSCSNAALRQTASDNISDYFQVAADTILKNFYMDDCLVSFGSEEEAVALLHSLGALCQKGGFRLNKWVSNSHNVLASVPPADRASSIKDLNLKDDELPCERAPGVFWNAESDRLGFKIKSRACQPTRRHLLSVVSSVFDPIGFAAPFILKAKQLMQDLCRRHIGWDDDLSPEDVKKWERWTAELPLLENHQVGRCYKPSDFGQTTDCQIHSFCDASDEGYGTVNYLRLVDHTGRVACAFLFAKSRVAPLKKTTTPRMELTSAALAVKTTNMLLRELDLKPNSVAFWTDSSAVLWYITNDKLRFKTFVANRVALIRDSTEKTQWRYVDTKLNPADLASKGSNIHKFLQNDEWFNGPEFLWFAEEDWPKYEIQQLPMNAREEVKELTCATVSDGSKETMNRLLRHFSSWTKLKKTTAWLLLAKSYLKVWSDLRKQLQQSAKGDLLPNGRTVDDEMIELKAKHFRTCKSKVSFTKITTQWMDLSESALTKYIQQEAFAKDLKALQTNGVVQKDSRLRRLDPVVENDILKVGGRLSNACISPSAKHPVILPRDSSISKLIVEEAHRRIGHLGKNSTLSYLRENFWILGVSTLVKGLLSKCVLCRKIHARKGEQKMANLPKERLYSDDPPFTRCGLDFFGPILVRRGRSSVKRYGAIFTCMSSRAIHLELVFSLDTDSCIHAIRRFIARRGPVQQIRSDNGTNFVSSNKELNESLAKLNHTKIHNFLLPKGISWVFNPPASSHFGGVWERLIRSVRRVLYALLREQIIRFDDEGLQTLLCEVESILNGRPLTTISCDPNDLEPLTPNHLLLMKSGETYPPGIFDKKDIYVKRRWRQIQYLADVFWKRWCKEYIPLLQERQKWHTIKKNLQVDDIVLIADNTPRNTWALGRISEVFPDRHGVVRVVKLQTKSGELTRPTHKLCSVLESETE